MKPYNVENRKTELRAWAYEVKITWNEAPYYKLIGQINDWCIDNRVKNQHNGSFTWFLKDESDLMAFKLRWG